LEYDEENLWSLSLMPWTKGGAFAHESNQVDLAILVEMLCSTNSDCHLLHILCNGIQKLHKKFCIIIISHTVDEIILYLSNVTHIQQKNIGICEPDNLDDIALYSHHRLDYVAWLKELQDWHNVVSHSQTTNSKFLDDSRSKYFICSLILMVMPQPDLDFPV